MCEDEAIDSAGPSPLAAFDAASRRSPREWSQRMTKKSTEKTM